MTAAPRYGFMMASAVGRTDRGWYNHFEAPRKSVAADDGSTGRLDRVVKKAEKLARIAATEPVKARLARELKTSAIAEPSTDRFAAPVDTSPVILAYADPEPIIANDAVAAVSAMAAAPVANGAETALLVEELPKSVPLPVVRPRKGAPEQPLLRTEPATRSTDTKLAYARPDDPNKKDGIGGAFKNLFGRPKAGNGVAVYDISAAKVYMPDGTVLEAHSGIGKMADNPRYTHVKMNGPTPPHTYNLKMRETRFHGVEAIRMLPVDGKNKHGRDGFLTHSYLLRGGRAESHGCVAFKDYAKFLNAFKQRKGDDGWRLTAGSLCFPSSWSLREKFGKPMSTIHEPVPGFGPGSRNAGLIDRMFDMLQVGRPVQRWNWSLQPGNDLYRPLTNTGRIERAAKPPKFPGADVFAAAFIRVERQTLRKLPQTGDILFTIRIHLDPLAALKTHPERAVLAPSFARQLAELDRDQLDYKGLAADRERLVAALNAIAS